MKRINLGRVTFVSDPSLFPQVPTPPQAKTQPQFDVRVVPLDTANALLGFNILKPTWLPSNNLKISRVSVKSLRSLTSHQTVGSILKYREDESHWLVIEQEYVQDRRKITVPFDAWEGRISDNTAAFFWQTVPASAQPNGFVNILQAVWEEQDFLVRVRSHGMEAEQVVRVCESLH